MPSLLGRLYVAAYEPAFIPKAEFGRARRAAQQATSVLGFIRCVLIEPNRFPDMGFGIYSIYRAIQPRLREQRMAAFLNRFHPSETTRILDVGGLASQWENVPIASSITMLNPDPMDANRTLPERFTYIRGDGRAMPFADQSFDIVYSNSAIEHLPVAEDQRRFAREIMRVGRSVFVQTPNRWFPIEPHFVTLFLHYLPKRNQRWVLPWCSMRGLFRSGDNVNLEELFSELRLLSLRQMRELFPGCVIQRERLLGMTKSLIAIRTHREQS